MKLQDRLILYHGTGKYFKIFDLKQARGFKDFGRGFYLTTSYRQAQRWAQVKAEEEAYIYQYVVEGFCSANWKVLELLQYDEVWIDFITESRLTGKETSYDIIYDRIADNQYFEMSSVLQRYSRKQISSEEAIQKIQWKYSDGDQYCFKNERVIKLLKRQETYIQRKDAAGIWRQVKV